MGVRDKTEVGVGGGRTEVGVRGGRMNRSGCSERDVGVAAGVQSFWGIIQGISVWLAFICINFNFRLITWPRRGR